MLLTSSSARRATFVPLLMLLFSAGVFAFSAHVLLQAGGSARVGGAVVGLVIGGGLMLILLGSCRTLRADGEKLVVRGFRKEAILVRPASAFGVRLQAGYRSSSFIVFVTDAEKFDDVADFSSEKAARRAIERLERCLLPVSDPADRRLARAKREIAAIENAWQPQFNAAMKTVSDYYASPAWRRKLFLMVGVVIIYCIGMSIYISMRSH